MNLQSRVHRRLHKHRSNGTGHAGLARDSHVVASPVVTAARHAVRHAATASAQAADPPHEQLLDYLNAVEEPASASVCDDGCRAMLQAAAHALMHNGDSLRLGVRAGDLGQRVRWFRRLLALWPLAERERWLVDQVAAGQRHPLAASPLHEELDPRLFDPALNAEQRLGLQALWLAVVAPGAVSLDAGRRERDLDEARQLLQRWLG